MRLIMLSVYVLSVAALLTYSQNELEQAEGRIFDDNPCTAPCWYGLYAGESSALEALYVVFTNDFQNFTKIDLTGVSFIHQDFNDYMMSSVSFENGIVERMVIAGSRENTVSMQDILDKLGSPTAIEIYRTFPTYPTNMTLYYHDFNMALNLDADSETCQLSGVKDQYYLRLVTYDSSSATYPSEDSPGVVPPLTKEELEAWLADDTDETCYNRTAQIEATYFESDAYNLALTPQAATLQANGIRLTEAAATRQADREMTWTAIAPTLTATPGAGE